MSRNVSTAKALAEIGVGARPKGMLPIRDGMIDPSLITPEFIAMIGGAKLPPTPDEILAEDFFGLTVDGNLVPGLFDARDEGLDPEPIADAARKLLSTLTDAQRERVSFPVDAPSRRLWNNAFPAVEPEGLRLRELGDEQRAAALGLFEASLSPEGYEDVRDAMRLNGELEMIVDDYHDSLGEWVFWISIFGQPGDRQWGWQAMGHHLAVNCFISGAQISITPLFLGAEYTGESYRRQRDAGLTFARSLSPEQLDEARLYASMSAEDLPPERAGIVDGRHVGGVGADNLVLAYEGIAANSLDAEQRELLIDLIAAWTNRLPAGPAQARLDQVRETLDETYVAWIGDTADDSSIYYRVHGPVVFIEYDNHAGIFLDNEEPAPFHAHSIMRTPNGGDYGMAFA